MVNNQLVIKVLAHGRLEEFQLVPELDGELAVVAHGDRTARFQQCSYRVPLDVVTCRVLEDLPQRIPMAAVKVFWRRRGHVPTLAHGSIFRRARGGTGSRCQTS